MGVGYWKSGGPTLMMLPNVTAMLLLAGTFLMLNWPPVSIRTSAIRINRGGLQTERLEKSMNCSRPCLDGLKPKECYFKFVLEPFVTANRDCKCALNDTQCTIRQCIPADGVERTMLTVNRQLPGTPVQVCEGDVVIVDVENHLPGLETSLHWHGQLQRGTPYMDGTPMITQCPIQSDTRFRYKFRASNPGTHFYHSHYVSHHADGIFGPLIIRQSPSHEPHYKMYDYDLNDHVMTIAPWSHSVLAYNLDFQENLKVSTLLINGKGNFYNSEIDTRSEVPTIKFAVRWGSRYRFRIINAASLDCPIDLQVEGHNLTVIATDGAPIQPIPTTHLILHPGERYDVVLDAKQEVSTYSIHVRGHHKCENVYQDALLVYDGATTSHASAIKKEYSINERSSEISTCTASSRGNCDVLNMQSLEGTIYPELQTLHADKTLFVPFDVYSYDNLDDKDINFNFTLDDIPYYPSYLYNRKRPVRLPQVGGITFSYPPSPLLSQPENVPENMLCEETCKETGTFCECLNILKVPLNISLDIVLIDQGQGSNQSNTFHLHGYSFHVLGSESLGHPIDVSEVETLYKEGKLARNLEYPPRKDTIMVPNKGYTILRIFTDNPGYWLFEARSTSPIISEGMQFLLQVGEQSHLPSVPPNFPRCGILKGPNFIF